jgi:hypothetical protein
MPSSSSSIPIPALSRQQINLLFAVYSQVVVAGTFHRGGTSVSFSMLAFPPNILTHPQSLAVRGSNHAATYGHTGSNVTFSVLATGQAPLAYQWRHNGAAIPGRDKRLAHALERHARPRGFLRRRGH